MFKIKRKKTELEIEVGNNNDPLILITDPPSEILSNLAEAMTEAVGEGLANGSDPRSTLVDIVKGTAMKFFGGLGQQRIREDTDDCPPPAMTLDDMKSEEVQLRQDIAVAQQQENEAREIYREQYDWEERGRDSAFVEDRMCPDEASDEQRRWWLNGLRSVLRASTGRA